MIIYCDILSQISPRGDTVLHMAVRSGQDELVHLILRRCLKLAESKNSMRNLPLQEAASIGRFPSVKILLFTAQQIQEIELVALLAFAMDKFCFHT